MTLNISESCSEGIHWEVFLSFVSRFFLYIFPYTLNWRVVNYCGS